MYLYNAMVHNSDVKFINVRPSIFVILKAEKLRLFRGHLFSNAVKIMLFISNTQYYVPIKLCRMAGSIHLFKNMGMLTPEM